jgi:hypothetical protein
VGSKQRRVKTLNFRVDASVSAMLHELAAEAKLSLTEYVTVFIRTMYKSKHPDKARLHETPLESFSRRVEEAWSRQPVALTGIVGHAPKGVTQKQLLRRKGVRIHVRGTSRVLDGKDGP